MMNAAIEKCFDEGTIQAFLDGELASDLSEKVACHVALCDVCAMSLSTAEEESSFAFAALDIEFNTLVPTERIRTRLFETIAAERKSVWQRVFGTGFRWTNPSVAAFASLLLVVGLFSALWIARENSLNDGGQIAAGDKPQTTLAEKSPATVAAEIPAVNPAPFEEVETSAPQIRPAAYKPKNENRFEAQKAVYRPNNIVKTDYVAPPVEAPSAAISGEESYLKTIATLQQSVENRKDDLLKPSMRVAFEKDMAVVDYAIKKMKAEVRRNPRNEAAKEVLRSSYQNKIDLLNSVADKSELMATLDKK
jgi:hypothetical protein